MNIGFIIMGAGKGTRMKSSLSKVMHQVANLPMVNHVMNAVLPLSPKQGCVVVGPHNRHAVQETVTPIPTVVQQLADGTGSAVKVCKDIFTDFTEGTIVILNGDTPLITTKSIVNLIQQREETKSSVALLGFMPVDPMGYGRILLNDEDGVDGIIEDSECNDEQRKISLCYSGVMAVDASILFPLVDKISNDNEKGEFYLTELIELVRDTNETVTYSIADEQELIGCDSKIDLATAESVFQYNYRMTALANGTVMPAPETVYFSWDTEIGNDVIIEPNVVFGEEVVLYDGVVIRSFSHLEECTVKNNCIIGPYARIRPGSVIEEDAKVGNFVELKNASIGKGSKINHLSYVGDAEIGKNCNLGAGTITCNYNGFNKSTTHICDGVFVGSNTSLVAPLKIEEGSIIGAGSVVTKNVPKDSLVIARANQENVEGAAASFRAVKSKVSEEV